jgi:surfeit locus 1 family protein
MSTEPPGTVDSDSAPLRRWSTLVLGLCAGLVFLSFIGLGSWQVWRLQWKTDLIARVDARVHAPATNAPDRSNWAGVTAPNDEYRHIKVQGTFLHERATRVKAVTVLGSGFWLMTPLLAANGDVVLVNRGFIPAQASHFDAPDKVKPIVGLPDPAAQSARPTTVTGLLRVSETGGAFLRKNDAANERWYSRDVEAIAAARRLGTVGTSVGTPSTVAPYFIDAEANAAAQAAIGSAAPGTDTDTPVAGLTVITFNNSHLVYAFTWFALALLMALAFGYILRQGKKR